MGYKWSNLYLTNRFCEDKLGLNLILNMVLESILTRFYGSIVPSLIGSLLDHPLIFSLTRDPHASAW